MKKLLTLFTILAIAVTMSCERLPEQKKVAPPTKGDLQTIKISDLKGIPLEYGTLVAITTRGTDTGKAELWFEDVNRTIRVVRVVLAYNSLGETVNVIPRY